MSEATRAYIKAGRAGPLRWRGKSIMNISHEKMRHIRRCRAACRPETLIFWVLVPKEILFKDSLLRNSKFLGVRHKGQRQGA